MGAVLLAAVAGLTARVQLASAYRSAALQVCDLVADNYYRRDEPAVRRFVADCRRSAETQTFYFSKRLNIIRINARLSNLPISHLSVYDPSESRMMWQNQGLDTGIRSRMIDDELVVYDVIAASAAAKAGIRAGDSLLALNGELIPSESDARTGAGLYRVRRGEDELDFEVRPEELTEDLRPRLLPLENRIGLLRIRSFLSQYFEPEAWKSIAASLRRYDALVIDVRDNPGGSFPAMMRALSPFRCDDPIVGRLKTSAFRGSILEEDLKDTLDVESQLRQIEVAENVRLRAFDDYGCFNGPVTVLIDAGTSSVAEIFAQAFFQRSSSKVWGAPSAGQVVMARWFPVSELGSDEYQISIPVAGYEAVGGFTIEDQGVRPQQYLWYELALALKGRDSWIESAVRRMR